MSDLPGFLGFPGALGKVGLVGLVGFGVRKTIPVTLYDATSITPECIVLSTESIATVVLKFLSAVLICTVLKHQVSKID